MAQTQSSTVAPQKVYKPTSTSQMMSLLIPVLGLGMGVMLLISALSTPHLDTATRAVLLVGAGIIALLGILVFLGFRRVHLVTSSQGVVLYGLGYKVYTPWSNIKELGTDWYGGNNLYGTRFYRSGKSSEGFLFYKPAVFGISIEEGMRRNVAVIQGWALLAVQLSRYANMLPLTGFLNDDTRQELIDDAKKYALKTFQATKQK
ncbi:hypothetical protein [Dictyobacter formicarum]|uniref:Uncharacterized protein n=1 Tax=Dictyobacter formicarum TaxID=2778368 RepID=A0ABQ3VI15_9CHLR|nr:hypothetical protein [Dictyobacter formicarum]GHO84766.1 hypothetical protein KSZ_27720 [Dictyobacter formicarum]